MEGTTLTCTLMPKKEPYSRGSSSLIFGGRNSLPQPQVLVSRSQIGHLTSILRHTIFAGLAGQNVIHNILEPVREEWRRREDDQMARREWGRTCRNQNVSLCAKERIFVYKVDFFVGFIGDEQLHAQECYVLIRKRNGAPRGAFHYNCWSRRQKIQAI
jgi:hypothetical protein